LAHYADFAKEEPTRLEEIPAACSFPGLMDWWLPGSAAGDYDDDWLWFWIGPHAEFDRRERAQKVAGENQVADGSEHYCARHKPVPRPGDPRYGYLLRKHR